MKNLAWSSLVALALWGGAARAAEPMPPPMRQGPPPELRAAMADNHDQMAACLRTTRPVSECRQEMLQRAQQAGGGRGGAARAKAPELSPEQRGIMAKAHAAVASCLRADRPAHECHQELAKVCQEAWAGEACPMMGMGMHLQAGPAAK